MPHSFSGPPECSSLCAAAASAMSLSSISSSPSGGCSSRDVAFPFVACLAAQAALFALGRNGFDAPAASPAARPPPLAPLEFSLEGLRVLMEPAFLNPPRPLSWDALGERVLTAHFVARCVVAGAAGLVMYLAFASLLHALFPRRPIVAGRERNIFALGRWDSDLSLGILGIVCGSPIQQCFMVCKEQFGLSLAYAHVADGRVLLPAWLPAPLGGLALEGWTWWAISIPVYLVLFDLVFYWTHLILQ